MLLALQVGADGHGDLANVDLGRCALGFSQQHPGVYIKLYMDPGVLVKVRHDCPLERLSPGSLLATHAINRLQMPPRRPLSAAVGHWVPAGKELGWLQTERENS